MTHLRPSPLVAALSLIAACASAGGRSARSEVRIEVRNDLVPATSIVVRAVGGGRRSLLGDVPPAGERELRFRDDFRGAYVLVARAARGVTVTSPRVPLRDGDRLVWQLSNNVLRFDSGGGAGNESRPRALAQ